MQRSSPPLPKRFGLALRGGPWTYVRQRSAATLKVLAWLYLAAMLACLLLLYTATDRWWPVTLFAYGPRWALLLPAPILLAASAWLQRWSLAPLSVATLLALGPVMGLCLPWQRLLSSRVPLFHLRVLSCNLDGSNVDDRALARLLRETEPDVAAFQECSLENPSIIFPRDQWYTQSNQGLFLASRYPIRVVKATPNAEGWRTLIVRYALETPQGALPFYNLHLETPRKGIEPVLSMHWRGIPELDNNTSLRWQESELALQAVRQAPGPVLLAGDFNMPDDSAIYRRHWSNYIDAFSSAGSGYGYTKHTGWWGIRIDHILASSDWRCRRCWVGADVRSDHQPVIADLDWVGDAE